MPLKDIIPMVAAHTGLDAVGQRGYIVALANQGAKDIYEKIDTVFCLREQLFTVDTTIQMFSLPAYVGELRAARIFNVGLSITIHDMAPRYASAGWREQYENRLLVWRNKGRSPLNRYGSNSGKLKISLKGVETQVVNVTVVGGNLQSTAISETVTIPVGAQFGWTQNSFTPEKILSISKDVITQFDVSITDMDDVELSEIANSELTSFFTQIQISDFPVNYNNNFQYVECIYKVRFSPMQNDYDCFVGGDRYDTAIYWAAIVNWAMRKEGKGDLIANAQQKCLSLITDIASNAAAGTEKPMDFGPNQYLQLLPRRWWPWQRVYR